ncbi:SusC/RagA family TonB-linked outer membrane protein [Reichenbachiella versicolor]|uniref:SusC/RagA family TonB-linked outer membrane protein n=1 Tax=Reichenbachiella versicolor TaxID=1821036 RepID=UPI000D6E67F3|nr:SusC/RagA family TonB-linked outer membrane protein [Reichenbachiella versicolor]
MKRIQLLVFLLLSCFSSVLLAQDRSVSGRIVDENDDPIPGATITIKGSTGGTISDLDGNWKFSAPEGATLIFSFVGMTTQEIEIGARSVIDVKLETDSKQLQEVVVTAFGIEQERKALSYSTQKVENKVVTQAAQPNLSNALQGKVAGLDIRQSSGMPGSSSYMTIRGPSFLNSTNAPLVVVDGMPIESEPQFTERDVNSRVSGSDASSRMLDINPADIESVDVLKGASAAALYGLRAANGVIIITTKKGQGLEKGMQVTYSTSYTADVVTRLPKLQSTYAQGNGGAYAGGTSMSWGPKISELGEYVNNVGETVTAQVYDNVDPFFKTGSTITNDISLSGASDKGSFNLSFGATNQDGFIPTTGMERYSGKFSGEFQLTDKFSVGSSMMYTNMHIDKIASGSNLSNPLFTTYFAPRSYNLWGTPYHVEGSPYEQIHYRAAMDNPRWSLANNEFTEDNDRFIGNIHFKYDVKDWLKLRYQIGMDQFTNSQKEVYELGSGETGGRNSPPTGGKLTDMIFTQRQLNSNVNLTFDKSFGDFNVNFMLGNEVYRIDSREMNVEGTGFSIGGFHNMSNTQSQIVLEEVQKRLVMGYYGNLILNWKGTVYLNATGRNDVTSVLAQGNRSFFYPSVGTSIVFTELFDIPQNILSAGKLRVGYAEVGQLPDTNYGTQNVFIPGNSAVGGFLTDGIQFPFSGQNAFNQSDILRSPDLKPQNLQTWEFGLEMNFLNSRVGVDYTYFSSTVEDQIFEVPIAPSSGYESEFKNAGTLKSTGHELTLNLVPIQNKDWRWSVGINFTKYNNEVEELADGVESIQLGGFTTPSVRALKGGTYPSIYGVGYLRDDQGRIVVYDDPGSPRHGMPIADPEAKKIGDVQPDFNIGFNSSVTYKGITLTALVDWRQGGQMYSGNNRLGALYGILEVTEKSRETPVVLDAVKGNIDDNNQAVVTGENDIAIVRGEYYWNTILGSIDEAHVFETTYVRFRELSIGYTIPRKWLDNIFINSATVSFVGRNLALWSKYPNFDPESSTTGATNGQGLEYVAHPQVASYGGRLSITF